MNKRINGLIKRCIAILTFASLLISGFIFIDNRYASSADVEKKFSQLEKSLKKIYIQNLKAEEREITLNRERRTPNHLTSYEKIRLEEIRQEIQELSAK